MLCHITCLSAHNWCWKRNTLTSWEKSSSLERTKSRPNHHYPTLSLTWGKGYCRGIKTPIWENHKISCTQIFVFSNHTGRGLYIKQEVLKDNCTLDILWEKESENHEFFQPESGNLNHKYLRLLKSLYQYMEHISWVTKFPMKPNSIQDQ